MYAVVLDVDVSCCLVAKELASNPNKGNCNTLSKEKTNNMWINPPIWRIEIQCNNGRSDTRDLLLALGDECIAITDKMGAHILRRKNQYVSVLLVFMVNTSQLYRSYL